MLLSKARVAARASEKTDELHQLLQLQQKQDAERPPEIQRDTLVPDRHEPVNPPAKAGRVAAGQAQQDSTQANGQADGQTVDLFREIEKKVLGR